MLIIILKMLQTMHLIQSIFFIVIYKNSNYLMAQRGNESNFVQVNEPVNQDNVLHILYNSR